MADFAHYHVATYRAGEGGYSRPLRPQHWEVWHDSKRYIYEAPRPVSAREVRRFISSAWDSMNGPIRIIGRFPSYTVEGPQ